MLTTILDKTNNHLKYIDKNYLYALVSIFYHPAIWLLYVRFKNQAVLCL